MVGEDQEGRISDEELYRIAYETRNFEIKLFWQRSNYFLVLNTALGVGFLSITETNLKIGLTILGTIVSLLWFLVNLGSKFWQSRWEGRLKKIEEKLGNDILLFSADQNILREDVRTSLGTFSSWWPRNLLNHMILWKPSVSLMMIILSILFLMFWIYMILSAWSSSQLLCWL